MTLIQEIAKAVGSGRGIDSQLALRLAELPLADAPRLFPLTRELRARASGNRVFLCSIVNAKSGRCAEDCRFCAQSSHYDTGIKTWPLLSVSEIVTAAAAAKTHQAREFGIVTSGKGITDRAEIETVAAAIAGVAALGIHPCLSPGIVSAAALRSWKAAGLTRYHHNLETAESFFPQICATHDYAEDVAALRLAQAHGVPICAGGIFGLGESWRERVELAELLRDLEAESVPMNFLSPIPGTPLAETAPGITPLEALKTIALFRLMLPKARIIVCGGRPGNLRDLQAMMFAAGANGLMIGNYLTTLGRPPEQDLQLLADLGLEPAAP